MRRVVARCAIVAFCILHSAFCIAKNHAFSVTAHGDKLKGPQRLADRPAGSCVQCHESGGRLFAPDDNELCFTCHIDANWSRSAHATSPQMLRGGAKPRPPADTGKCVNCHDPHGAKDNAGVVPALLDLREPALCVECHDGSRGADIRHELAQPFRHGMDARGKHDPAEGNDPAKFAVLPATNRHVSCSDCHNVHRAGKDRIPTVAPDASTLLAGVSRVEVANGPAGTAPRYTWHAADDPAPALEYEICFKCHSSWTRLGPGQPDLALLTNPANASFHPIQAQGKNAIDPQAFAGQMSPASVIVCSDCHAAHGSSYRGLIDRADLCFACHASDVYGNANATADMQRASRFNAPSTNGHAFHVAQQQIACSACHEAHGSARHAALIATGRMPGITSYTQTPTGGTCTSTCHGAKTYAGNYGR